MKIVELYEFLMKAHDKNMPLIITFDGGDKYHLSNIDICPSLGRDGKYEYEPLRVNFEQCLTPPLKQREAFEAGYLKTPGVFWTSKKPLEPVSADYHVEEILEIYDDEKQYTIYEK